MSFSRIAGLALCSFLFSAGEVSALGRHSEPVPQRALSKIDNSARCDVNNLDFIVTNHGSIMFDLTTGDPGLVYPRGTQKTAVFAAGLWIGAKVNDSLRVTVGEYSQEYVPGPMRDGVAQADEEDFRVYRITPGDTESTDYREWPVDQGAPVDSLGNPEVLGDVTLWCVYNDADPTVHVNGAGNTAPLGIEIQQTVFAFNQQNPLSECAFMKYLVINKGGRQLDSMFVSFWSDPDVGGFGDDLVGCDTSRSLGYSYNATNEDIIYGKAPPAVGFDFFQGPMVPEPGNPGQQIRLPMASFNRYVNGTDPVSATQSYNYMQGLAADGSAYEYPPGVPTPFQLAGDPVTAEGDLDEGASDRRLQLSTGPFSMAPGDTQQIVVGVVMGQGANRLSSIRVMQSNDDFAQAAYDLDFKIAVPPSHPVVSAREFDGEIDLVWSGDAEGSVSTNEVLDQEYHFQGYNVYQGASIGGPWQKIATFDLVDDVGVLFDDVFAPELGTYQRLVVQNGLNEGITNHMRITTDAIRGGKLINNREYYFAATAYSHDVRKTVPNLVGGAAVGHFSPFPLESGLSAIAVVPAGSGAVLTDRAEQLDGRGDGDVVLEYLHPEEVEGLDYEILFDRNGAGELTWRLEELGTTRKTVLEGQTKFDGDYTYPIVNGIMVRVIGPDPGAKGLVEVCEDGTESEIVAASGSVNCTGEWYIDPLGEGGLDRMVRFDPPYHGNHDYEIRFLEAPTAYAWDYFWADNGHSGRFPGMVPWEIWDIGIGTPDDSSDDVQITGMVLELFEDAGEWGWEDGIYFRNIPYDDVDWENPDVNSSDYDPDEERLGYGRLFFFRADGDFEGPPVAPGTRIRLVTNKTLGPEDRYAFRAKAPGTSDGTVLDGSSRIYPIPNPYYNRSAYELTSFDRVLRFSYLPSRPLKLRIFSLAGDLVRTLDRPDPSQGTLDWDLLSDRGVAVASGIYFWIAEMEGGETQKGKLAVFIEKERLNSF